MMMLYVGNLAQDVTEEILREVFEAFGTVVSVKVIRGFADGASKGFGFVRMAEDGEAENAIRRLHGTPLHGKTLAVSKARTGRDRRSADRRRRDRRTALAGSHWNGPEARRGRDQRRDHRRRDERREGFQETGRLRHN